MEGSGLEKLLVQVYSGKNVVSHMMSGKAISRVLRRVILGRFNPSNDLTQHT